MFLSEVLRNFDSQLSQEQTWGICYMMSKHLASVKRENLIRRKNVWFFIEPERVKLNNVGSIDVMQEETARKQSESDIIRDLGYLICRCLDSDLDVSLVDNENFDVDLSQLISGMTLQRINESDEGYEEDYGAEIATQRNNAMRPFRNLDEICRFCENRLEGKKIKSGGEHYRNVVRALYREAFELNVFLCQVTSSLTRASEGKADYNLNPNVATTAQECVYEWARFWLQVMHELRRGVHLRKVTQQEVSPFEYELSPSDMVTNCSVSTGILAKPDERSKLPENAGNIILDFILSRSQLQMRRKSSSDVVGEIDMAELKENLNASDNNLSSDIIQDRRKPLKVGTPLLSKIKNWDASQDSLLSDDFNLSRGKDDAFWEQDILFPPISRHDSELYQGKDSSNPDNSLDKRKLLQRRRSAEIQFDDDVNANIETRVDHGNGCVLSKSKKRLAASSMFLTEISLQDDSRVFGTSLFEISKIRKAITAAETECFSTIMSKGRRVADGKVCFSCKKFKFKMFSKSHQCDICQKKFCFKCISPGVEIPNHLVDVKCNKQPEQQQQKQGQQQQQGVRYNFQSSRGLSKSTGNLSRTMSDTTVTPFQCKRQSILQIGGRKNTFGGKIADVCKECKIFMDSIVTETKNMRWHVGITLDI